MRKCERCVGSLCGAFASCQRLALLRKARLLEEATPGYRVQQVARVGFARSGEHGGGRAFLDDAANLPARKCTGPS